MTVRADSLSQCSFDSCDNEVKAKGLCGPHYRQLGLGRELEPLKKSFRGHVGCTVEGCNNEHHSLGMCRNHYTSQHLKGKRGSSKRPTSKRYCSVNRCSLKHYAMGFCKGHYGRQRTANASVLALDSDLSGLARVEVLRLYIQAELLPPTWKRENKKLIDGLRNNVFQASRQLKTDARRMPGRPCSVPGCDRTQVVTELCQSHYGNSFGHIRRSAVKTGDLIDVGTLGKRDNWHCYLCDESVDFMLPWPDPLSKSIDHVVPLTVGGEHIWENVKLAHLRCNIRKKDKSLSEWEKFCA